MGTSSRGRAEVRLGIAAGMPIVERILPKVSSPDSPTKALSMAPEARMAKEMLGSERRARGIVASGATYGVGRRTRLTKRRFSLRRPPRRRRHDETGDDVHLVDGKIQPPVGLDLADVGDSTVGIGFLDDRERLPTILGSMASAWDKRACAKKTPVTETGPNSVTPAYVLPAAAASLLSNATRA